MKTGRRSGWVVPALAAWLAVAGPCHAWPWGKKDCPPSDYSPWHILAPSFYRWNAFHHASGEYIFPVDRYPCLPLNVLIIRYPCPPVDPGVFSAGHAYPLHTRPELRMRDVTEPASADKTATDKAAPKKTTPEQAPPPRPQT